MRLNRVFRDLDPFEYKDVDLVLDVGFVPLRGVSDVLNEKGLVVKCPMCGLVMVYIGDGKVMCPECGLYG